MFSTLLLSAVGALSVVPSVLGTSCSSSLKTALAVDASSFSTIAYDYVIVGGGTAGLAVASRLAETTGVLVGLIEAGIYHDDDPLLEVPSNSIPGGQGNPIYDWVFSTTPQAGANGRVIGAPRGKMMGGSSGLNLMAWNRASKPEYDVWSTFSGSSTWSWAGLTSYFAKSQSIKQGQTNPFPGVSPAGVASSFTHGSANGPVNVSLNVLYSDVVPDYVKTWNALGIQTNSDADSGSNIGIFNSRMSIDRTLGIRSYAGNGYFEDSCSRSNLHVLTGAQATKVLFQWTKAGYVATGVTFTAGLKSFTANANKEVILASGSVKTPQLLELSGIGNSTLLKSLGIPLMINLPQVGENMQEHVFSIVEFELNPGHHTFDELNNNATLLAQQTALYAANKTGLLAANDAALAFLPFQSTASAADQATLLAAFDAQVASCSPTPIQKLQYKAQRDWIVQGNVPMTETIMLSRGLIAPEVGQSYITLLIGAQHPMARGSIHINSADPLAAPVINGNYLDNDFDVQTILQGLKFLLKLGKTAPLSASIKALIEPTVTSDADLIQWIRNTLSTGSHIMGTAALATQAQGGVVDANLLVYGTTNLRIVDSSIIPFSIATHLQSTVYAIAEKAADIIKAAA